MPQFPATHDGREYPSEWRRVAEDQQRFIGALTPARLTEELTYVNMKGEHEVVSPLPYPDPLREPRHVHRRQITHLLRDLGCPRRVRTI